MRTKIFCSVSDVQACFKGQIAIRAILSLPILRELTAVEQLLAHQLAVPLTLSPPANTAQPLQQPDMRRPPAAYSGVDGQMHSKEGQSDLLNYTDEMDKDFTCAICMVSNIPGQQKIHMLSIFWIFFLLSIVPWHYKRQKDLVHCLSL